MRSKDPLKAESIRAKALEMLAKEGFDGFSMQKLAKAAGVSPATLYIHFEDRDDLLFQLYREQLEVFTQALLVDFDPNEPFQRCLEVQWRNRLRFCRENPASWSLVDQILHSPYHKGFSKRLDGSFFHVLGEFVRNGVARGELHDFRGEDPKGGFQVFWSLAYAPLYELIRFESERSLSKDGGVGTAFRITPEVFQNTLRRVLRALQP